MKSSSNWLGRQVAVSLVLLISFTTGDAGSAIAQQPIQRDSAPASRIQPSSGETFADTELPENPAPAGQGQQSAAPQPGVGQSQDSAHKPVGTAAAPYEPIVGIAASRPAGAAIAPAKQHRVRSIVISLGIIAGAGIAIGSVAALSHGSPSHP